MCGNIVFNLWSAYFSAYNNSRMSERVLPKERGSKLEQKLIEVMVEQYYHYISLMRMTNNF